MQSIGSITTFGMNKILLMFSSTAATVYGVYFKLQSFIFMPVFGMNNGMIPIIAYNYGAGHEKTYYRHNPHEYPDRDWDHDNRSDHLPDHSRLPDESAVQCFRTYAVHRRTGTADYFAQFPLRWILYCSRICIPGTGKWRLQLARICCQTVIRHPSGRIYLCQAVRITYGMVGYPDCRDRFRNPVCTAVKANLPNKSKAFRELINTR